MKTRPESVRNNTVKTPNLQGQKPVELGHKRSDRNGNNHAHRPIPSALADEAKTALEELQSAGAAASSLAMLMSKTIAVELMNAPKEGCFPEWPQFVELNIEAGIVELVIGQVSRFREALTDWRIQELSIITSGEMYQCKCHLEHEAYCLDTMLNSLTIVLADHYSKHCGPSVLAFKISSRLLDAWRKSLTLHARLLDARENINAPEPFKKAA